MFSCFLDIFNLFFIKFYFDICCSMKFFVYNFFFESYFIFNDIVLLFLYMILYEGYI